MKTQTPRATSQTSESLARLEKLVMMQPRAALNVVFVYEDSETREWAREIHQRVSQLADSNGVRPTWWRLDNLFEPGILAAAVSTAMRADVIVVAVRGEEGLPLPFYTWVNNWLPHRLQHGGVLVALQGKAEQRTARSGRVGSYLRTVARQAHLNFLMAQRKLTSPVPAIEGANGAEFTERANGHKINNLLSSPQRNGHAVRMSIR